MTSLARMGKPVTREDLNSGRVQSGDILVFVDKQLEAKHSCVMKAKKLIGGYNQLDWYQKPGKSSDYSEHAPEEVRWVKAGVVRLNIEGSSGFLRSIPARQAMLYFRGNFRPV